MSSPVLGYIFVMTCTLGIVYCTYSQTYGSSYKGVQSSGVLYQQVPVPVYKPVPVYRPVAVPVTLNKGIGGYGVGGFPGSFGGFGGLGGFGGGDAISSVIFLVIIISVIRNLF